MKIRTNFVSNSSSSSFIITDVNHEGLKKLINYMENGEMYKTYNYVIDMEDLTAHDNDDNAIWWICSEYLGVNHEEFLEEFCRY